MLPFVHLRFAACDALLANMTGTSRAARHIREEQLFISIVTETYPPEVNGVAMTTGKLVDGLMRRGHRICLIRPRQFGNEAAKATALLSEILVAGMPLPLYAGLRIGLPFHEEVVRMSRGRVRRRLKGDSTDRGGPRPAIPATFPPARCTGMDRCRTSRSR